MTGTRAPAPIVILDPDQSQARQIAQWLGSAGLRMISAVRTCDEAIFMLGRRRASLLIIDEHVSEIAERRLLSHIAECGHGAGPPIVRLIGPDSAGTLLNGRARAVELVSKPLEAHDVVVRVGTAMQRTDLVGRLDRDWDQAAEQLATARRMQLGLLPSAEQLIALQAQCGVGLSGLYRSGDAVGGDFWGAWSTGRGRLALTVADFAGHGLGAALNTFRLHAILSKSGLPLGLPVRMLGMLNARLHGLLPRGQYATMVYALIDPATHFVAWSSAGGPPPMFVSTTGTRDLEGRGLPLGVRPATTYRSSATRLDGPGILCIFSDGLYESGLNAADVPRTEIARVLAAPAALAAEGQLAEAADLALRELGALRNKYVCLDHSDDVVAACVALGTLSS